LNCSGGGENDCLSCDTPLYFENGKCVDQCLVGFYQNDNSHTCDSCPEPCLTCNSRNIYVSFILFLSFLFISRILLLSYKYLATNCLTCQPKYSLYGRNCVDECPDGLNSNNGICSRILFFSFFLSFVFLY